MDLLAELQRKLPAFETHQRHEGLKAAIRHIEMAERYFKKGRDEEETDYFNDVVYRTNQAFEGMLKEAYTVLTAQEGSKLSPHQIEQHFQKEKRLTERVQALFTNYRQQWRNPSTHDHTLMFSEQEGLLAIVSVSAFAAVLLDQMIETINFQREKLETEHRREAVRKDLSGYEQMSLGEKVASLLKSFGDGSERHVPEESEVAVIGRLSGFMVGVDPSLKITPEASVGDRHRADLLIKRGNDAVIVEVKRSRARPGLVGAAVHQVATYLESFGVDAGVAYIFSPDGSTPFSIKKTTVAGGAKPVWVVTNEGRA